MRPLRYLILLLVLAIALLVALIRPLPGHATETVATRTKTKRFSWAWDLLRRQQAAMERQAALAIAATPPPPLGVRAVTYAKKFIGVPYSYGGSSPRTGFDCSGFVRYVYQRFGISLPHSSYSDLSYGRRVLRKYLKPGDLVFFNGGGHVGIYVGSNRLIDALHTGTVIRISTMAGWYSDSFYAARRLAPAS
ncbi:MAG: peptidoglycan DL-endopeptidase CwlO [Gaiellaceae bacterium]|jgi:cell wall-associated NlpC family hydrolase|nr:peptidoglycan DL-endopeptidase CwlO [Gaiellaceae bacterium]